MNKDELLKELQKLKDEDYSNDALFNDGYRTSMMDAIDLVKKLNIDDVSKCSACGTKVDKVYCDVCVCKGLESYEQ
jgi:hypothetical protein